MNILMNKKSWFRFIETLNVYSTKYLELKKSAGTIKPINSVNNSRNRLYLTENNNIISRSGENLSRNFDLNDDFCNFM